MDASGWNNVSIYSPDDAHSVLTQSAINPLRTMDHIATYYADDLAYYYRQTHGDVRTHRCYDRPKCIGGVRVAFGTQVTDYCGQPDDLFRVQGLFPDAQKTSDKADVIWPMTNLIGIMWTFPTEVIYANHHIVFSPFFEVRADPEHTIRFRLAFVTGVPSSLGCTRTLYVTCPEDHAELATSIKENLQYTLGIQFETDPPSHLYRAIRFLTVLNDDDANTVKEYLIPMSECRGRYMTILNEFVSFLEVDKLLGSDGKAGTVRISCDFISQTDYVGRNGVIAGTRLPRITVPGPFAWYVYEGFTLAQPYPRRVENKYIIYMFSKYGPAEKHLRMKQAREYAADPRDVEFGRGQTLWYKYTEVTSIQDILDKDRVLKRELYNINTYRTSDQSKSIYSQRRRRQQHHHHLMTCYDLRHKLKRCYTTGRRFRKGI